jgi:hypothetical protein
MPRAEVHMSKYDPIHDLLGPRLGRLGDPCALAELVDGGLLRSTYRYGAWWSSDDDTHVQSRSWSSAGYHAEPDLSAKTVRFVSR